LLDREVCTLRPTTADLLSCWLDARVEPRKDLAQVGRDDYSANNMSLGPTERVGA